MNLTTTNNLTMSSREIAELTGKRHPDVKRDIEKMLIDLSEDVSKFARIYSDSMNRNQTEILLDRDHTECLLTGYSAVLRMKVIKRWKELESKSAQPVSLPSTKQLALMVIQAEEEKEQALLLVEQKSQHIEKLESLFHSGGTIAQFVKQLNGVNSQRVNTWLNENTKWLYDENKGKIYTQGAKQGQPKPYSWRCASYARDKYLTETNYNLDRQGMESMVKYEVQLLADGKKWLFDKYIKSQLPMKANWDGEFTHKTDLV